MAIFHFINWIVATKSIEGGNYSREETICRNTVAWCYFRLSMTYWFIFNQFWHCASARDVRACASTGDSLCVVHTRTRLKDHLYVRILRNSWLTCTNSTAYSQQVASNYTCSHFLVFLFKWGINSTKVSSKTKKEMVFDIILFFMYTFFIIARSKNWNCNIPFNLYMAMLFRRSNKNVHSNSKNGRNNP